MAVFLPEVSNDDGMDGATRIRTGSPYSSGGRRCYLHSLGRGRCRCTGAPRLSVALVLFDGAEEIDFVGPWAPVTVAKGARFVDEGHVITASGVSADIDTALHLVGRLWGPPVARFVQKAIEYFPDPPFGDVPIRQLG